MTTANSADYAAALIRTSLAATPPLLTLGSFTLKSGRLSPYFFNFGLFNTGALLHSLVTALADAVIARYPLVGLVPTAESANDDSTPQVLFGPAYKGIPLVAALATELARRERGHIGYAYNRKEAKAHGEGGSLVGASLSGQRVLIIDDVITAGTAIRQAHALVHAEGGHVVALLVALDREERGGEGPESTVMAIERELGVPVLSVVKLRDIVGELERMGRTEDVERMQEYRRQYGIRETSP